MTITFYDGQAHRPVSIDEPLPVQVSTETSTVVIKRDIRKFGPTAIPGIAAADAFDANDQFGSVLIFTNVPTKGTITEMVFHDLDDEGINKFVYVFSAAPTLAASDAAFDFGDQDNLNCIAVFSFTTWRDNASNQLGFTANTPCDYVLPNNGTTFWLAVQTVGADSIAAGSMPEISFMVEVAQ